MYTYVQRITLLMSSLCIPVLSANNTKTIHEAVQNGLYSKVKRICKRQWLYAPTGNTINARDDWENTPLHYAAYYDNTEIAHRLIISGAHVNTQNSTFPIFLSQTPQYVDGGYTALHYAARNNNIDLIHMLVHNGASLNLYRTHTQYDACMYTDRRDFYMEIGSKNDIRWATLYKVKSKTSTYTPLHDAILAGNIEATQALLENGADCNEHIYTREEPLLVSHACGSRTIENETYTRTSRGTALHYAAAHNWSAMIHLLIQYNADINAQDSDGNTPFDIARQRGCKEAANILAQAKA